MCGRYAAFLPAEALAKLFATVNPPANTEPTWNMAPTHSAPVVRLHPQTGARHLDLLRWGLVAHWVTDLKATRQPINARTETAATTPMFRDAMARRHCLVPVDAFYEWQAVDESRHPPSKQPPSKQAPSKQPPSKQPWAIARTDGQTMALAGLWEGWKGPDGEVIRSFAILTTRANETLRPIHERMPVVLEPEDWPLWLGLSAFGDPARLLRPSEAKFRCWPVSTAVNNVRNNSAALLDPVPAVG